MSQKSIEIMHTGPSAGRKQPGQKGRTLWQAQDSCIRIFSGSANRLREVLVQALPERAILQQAVNRILRAQTPQEVKKYSKGRFKRKGARWFAYAVGQLPHSVAPHQVFEMYRQRFGIETSYRQTPAPTARCGVNQVCAYTTSRNPVLRLMFVGLAFILFNLYIAWR